MARLNPGEARNLSVMRKHYGATLQKTGELAAARAQYQQAIAMDRRRVESEPNNVTARRDLSYGHASLANLGAGAGTQPEEGGAVA